jgi:hypothetical protein
VRSITANTLILTVPGAIPGEHVDEQLPRVVFAHVGSAIDLGDLRDAASNDGAVAAFVDTWATAVCSSSPSTLR